VFNIVGDALNKPKTKPIKRKKAKTSAVTLPKKELLLRLADLEGAGSQVYNLLRAFAKLLEEAEKQKVHLQPGRAMYVQPVERKNKHRERHLARAMAKAETWDERDQVCRSAAAFCFSVAKAALKTGDQKNAQKWTALSHRYFKLSMDPKKQITEEEIQHLEDMLEEIRENQKQEENTTNS